MRLNILTQKTNHLTDTCLKIIGQEEDKGAQLGAAIQLLAGILVFDSKNYEEAEKELNNIIPHIKTLLKNCFSEKIVISYIDSKSGDKVG